MQQFRLGGGWLDFGVLVPKEHEVFRASERHVVELPGQFEYALMSVNSLAPSLTAVTVCFVCNDANASAIREALQQERTSFAVRSDRSFSIKDPADQKTDDVRLLRQNLAKASARWFSDHLPGLFSSGILKGSLPVCELTTTEMMQPFPSRQERVPLDSHLRLTDLWTLLGSWSSTKIPGLRFQGGTRSGRHAVLAAKKSELAAVMGDSYGEGRSARVNFMSLFVGDLLLMWSLGALLDGYITRISEFRSSEFPSLKQNKKAVDALERLENLVQHGADVAGVATEIIDRLEHRSRLCLGMPEFVLTDGDVDTDDTLEQQFRHTVQDHAQWLERLESDTRAHASQLGNLLSARENVRMQQRIGRLTVLIAIMTGVTLIVLLVQASGN